MNRGRSNRPLSLRYRCVDPDETKWIIRVHRIPGLPVQYRAYGPWASVGKWHDRTFHTLQQAFDYARSKA